MAKPKIPYRVTRGFEVFRKGMIIYPTGMRKSELLMRGVIEKAEDLIAPAPVAVPEPEPAPVADNIETPDEPDAMTESATMPEPETEAQDAPTPRRKKRRHGY